MANASNSDSATSGTSKLLSFTPTANRLLILALGTGSAVASVSGGGTWTQIGGDVVGGNAEHESLWWAVASGGATTPNWGTACTEMVCCEYDVFTTGLEATDVGSGSGTPISSNAIAPAAVDILIAMTFNTTGAVTYTGSWVVDQTVINNEQLEIASILNAAPGSYSVTTSGNYSNWEARIAGLATGSPDASLRVQFRIPGRPGLFTPGNAR